MLFEPKDIPAIKPDSFKNTIPVQKAVVEHRHLGISGIDELSIQIDLHSRRVAAQKKFCRARRGKFCLCPRFFAETVAALPRLSSASPSYHMRILPRCHGAGRVLR